MAACISSTSLARYNCFGLFFFFNSGVNSWQNLVTERKARRALIEAAEGSEEKKSSTKSKSSQDAKGKSAKGKAKAKRPSSRRSEDKASQTRSKRSHKDPVSSARKVVDPKSPCSIMKACGGCTALNRPYKKQLAAKQAAMEELFAALCEREGISVDPIRGMGVTLGDPGKVSCAAWFSS